MSQSQREDYYDKIMKKSYDNHGDASKIKRVNFPNQAHFYFDNHRLNYNYIEKTT